MEERVASVMGILIGVMKHSGGDCESGDGSHVLCLEEREWLWLRICLI